MDFQTFFLTNLNDQQRAAVIHGNGPLLVTAGAGSGKTRIIIARIAQLITQGHNAPASIVALTFTNKAATEMRERINSFLKENQSGAFIGTFHGYCLRLLRAHGTLIGLEHFTILDDDDQYSLIKKILERADSKLMTARQVQHRISLRKNGMTDTTHYLIDEISAAYEAEKTASHCLDFDDLLLKTLDLFKQPHFANQWRTIVRHVLIDEYQDTNRVQHALLKAMAMDGTQFAIDSLCAVGDEDQSIYSWRGATVENILSFNETFPNTRMITVERNYRSVQPILTAANHLIGHNRTRNPKALWSQKNATDRITLLACRNEYHEAEMIAGCLKERTKHVNPTQIAILYRTHAQSRVLEEALIKQSIAYRIIGGTQFYERKEVKDILAYVRLVVNPYDRVAFARVLNCPPRKLGDAVQHELAALWQHQPFLSYAAIAQQAIEKHSLKPVQQKNLQTFVALLATIDSTQAPSLVIEQLVNAIAYYDYLRDTHEPTDADARIQNVQELINAAMYFYERGIRSCEQLLQEIALLQGAIKEQSGAQCIQLMTLHAAKGLEFDTVFIAGLEDGILPGSKSFENEANLEEERRLLYVGITRAQNYLLLTKAEFRSLYGKPNVQLPSRFLDELPENLIHNESCIYYHDMQARFFAAQWFNQQPPAANREVKQSVISIKPSPHYTPPPRTPKPLNKPVAAYTPQPTHNPWKVLQPVTHDLFGVGLVQAVDKKDNGKIYLTIQFKSGKKTIESSFIK